MKKRLILLIIFIFISCYQLVIARCNADNFTPFTLITVNNKAVNEKDIFIKGKSIFSDDELYRIIYVLEYYNENYIVDDKKVLIPIQLSKDLDLLANYSRKAFDSSWLHTRANTK